MAPKKWGNTTEIWGTPFGTRDAHNFLPGRKYTYKYSVMSSLVPYAASEMGPTALDVGVAIGKQLGAAGIRKAHQWATKPTPARKKARTKYRSRTPKIDRVGERVGTSSSKWDSLNLDYTNMSPLTLQQLQLLNITKTAGSDAYDRRLHDQFNFRGIKVCMNFRAEGALGTAKAHMNVAIISPKSELFSSNNIPSGDFFRDPSGASRSADFGDPALLDLDYHCSAINTDKYNVHKRMKFEIGPSGSTEGNKEKFIDFYVPVKRQIRYGDTIYPEGKNMYLIWWYSASDGGAPANAVRFSYRVTRYFKETVGL